MSEENPLLAAALQYAGRGWPVMPVHTVIDGKCSCGKACESPGKHPRLKRGLKDASTDRDSIVSWWSRWPTANIAVCTGHNGLTILDPDDAAGMAELQAIVAECGPFPPTLVSQTGRGFHLWFHAPGMRTSSKGKMHVRGVGGYALAPPSRHSSGISYRFINSLGTADLTDPHRGAVVARQGRTEREEGVVLTHLGDRPAHLTPHAAGTSLAVVERALAALAPEWTAQEEERLGSALDAIGPDCGFDAFIRYGIALHRLSWQRSDGTDAGYAIWDEWCSKSKFYNQAGLEKHWLSFGRTQRNDGVTIASIFHDAKLAGWVELGAVNPSKLNGSHALPAFLTQHAERVEAGIATAIEWRDSDKNGFPRPTCTTAWQAITGLGIECRKDRFAERALIDGHLIDKWSGQLTDECVLMLRRVIKDHLDIDCGDKATHDAAVQLCLANEFDPIADYLGALQWDGASRLGQWLSRYLGAEATPLTSEIGRLTLVAAVRRVRQPGAKFDQIIVLEGPEGRGKSSAVEILAGPEHFSDQRILTLDDKGQQEAVQGIWLFEIADLAGIHKAEVEAVKVFASRKFDRARPAYGRARVDRPRRCIFFASTNDDRYLKSSTGDRRFWPVQCGTIDLESLARDRDQLWAEAAAIEARGASIGLAEKWWAEAATIQASRRVHDPWEDDLRQIAQKERAVNPSGTGDDWRISSRDLLENVLKVPADRRTDVTAKRLAFVMRRLGWDGPKVFRQGEHTVRGYTKALSDSEKA